MRSASAGLLVALALATGAGCSAGSVVGGLLQPDGSGGTPDAATDDATSGSDDDAGDAALAMPPRPELGEMIDRAGRPGINLMLVDVFDFDNQRDALADQYNQDGQAESWGARYQPALGASLALFDVFDGVCGNQARFDPHGGGPGGPNGYGLLAADLADDRLYLDARLGRCTRYRAVEQADLDGTPVTDCGGRAPGYDVMDATYALLAGPAAPIGDGVSLDPNAPLSSTFPFFPPPSFK